MPESEPTREESLWPEHEMLFSAGDDSVHRKQEAIEDGDVCRLRRQSLHLG
jgi:hypothetical protein